MKAALYGDPITGICIHTHQMPNDTIATISGSVNQASPNVRFDGVQVARVGDSTTESDCCHSGSGMLIIGSGTVRANGIPIAYAMQATQTHGTSCALSGGGSTTVNVG